MKKSNANSFKGQPNEMIEKGLKSLYLFPTSVEEVDEFECNSGNTPLILHERLKNLDFMDKHKNIQWGLKEKPLGMAAREGNELPEAIKQKILNDIDNHKQSK